MTKEEFCNACQSGGYCTKKQAEEWCGDREEFTESDFIEAYRQHNRFPTDKFHTILDRNGVPCKTTYTAYGMSTNYWNAYGTR